MRPLKLRRPAGLTRIAFLDGAARLEDHCPRAGSILVTDRRVFGLHRSFFSGWKVLFVGRGEGRKTLAAVDDLLKRLLHAGADRTTTVAAVGGGVVSDVAGLAAALYMRGLRLVIVPTTLLAQADACLGGKNGVNLDRFKNMIGTIRQPDLVLIDTGFLETLPRREARNGLAEIVKSAAVADAGLFRDLECQAGKALALDPAVMRRFIERSLRVKARIVERDELEAGPRRLLNFGHTFGHALEREGRFSHGEAIAVGMCAAARISTRLGLLPETESARLIRLIRSLGLPASAGGSAARALASMDKDKKRAGNVVRFVLLKGAVGRAIVRPIPAGELKEHFDAVC